MNWIKDSLVDIAVTIVMALAVFLDLEWARWAIMIYTPFMLAIRVYTYATRFSLTKVKATDVGVPPFVFHLLYGANVIISAFDFERWWWITGSWVVIWILSALSLKHLAGKK